MYVALSPSVSGKDKGVALSAISAIGNILNWLVRGRLKLKARRNKLLLIGNWQQLAKVNLFSTCDHAHSLVSKFMTYRKDSRKKKKIAKNVKGILF